MSITTVISDDPVRESWDFGDFPFALEPLTLPDPGSAAAGPDRGGPPPRFSGICTHLLDLAEGRATADSDEPFESTDRLYWFRWITGHQATFAIWQLLAAGVAEVDGRPDDRPEIVSALTDLVHGYCAMLLYTSSTPAEVYHELIRPSMFLQHRSFSGTWAPDFAPVRSFLRGREPWLRGETTREAGELAAAIRTYDAIHAGIAARLVPGGRSLLQHAVTSTADPDPSVCSVLYDNYFMTLRAGTDVEQVVAQLVRRLNAIARDVVVNGLYVTGGSEPSDVEALGDPVPDELRWPEVKQAEDRFLHLLACCAATASTAAARVPGRTR